MKQFTIISKLLAILISPEELMELLEKHNYKDVARKFKVEDLFDFFVAAALEKWFRLSRWHRGNGIRWSIASELLNRQQESCRCSL